MKVWLEKTRVKNREYKKSGPYALGAMLFSPLTSKDGSDFYKNMREPNPEDLVLHLTIEDGLVGISKVASRYTQSTFTVGSVWDGEGYQILLKDFVKLDPIIKKQELLPKENKELLLQIKERNKVFYDKNLDLNQGAYITY